MPIYEFQCGECGTKMEVLQKFDDPAPVCGCGHAMHKLISASTFHLKGGGWYATDYAAENNQLDKTKYGNTKEGQAKGIPSDID